MQVPDLRGVTLQAKQTVRELLDRLPDDCSLEDVQYHLYVIQAVERGRADIEAGRTIPHEEVVRELRKKWLTDAAG
jgi:predicted transcriptional regulator